MGINYSIINLFLFNLKFKKLRYNNNNNDIIFINETNLSNLFLHLKFSLLSYSTIIVDTFGYNKYSNQETNLILSNMFSTYQCSSLILVSSVTKYLKSMEGIFLNVNWMERESSEMLGLVFKGKTDSRNILLQYFDSTSPLNKSISSIGDFELFYNIFTNSIIKFKTHVS